MKTKAIRKCLLIGLLLIGILLPNQYVQAKQKIPKNCVIAVSYSSSIKIKGKKIKLKDGGIVYRVKSPNKYWDIVRSTNPNNVFCKPLL